MMAEGHLFSYQKDKDFRVDSSKCLLDTEEMKLAACWSKINGLSRREIFSRNAPNNLSL